MDYLPFFLKMKGRPALVVGAGEVAARKARRLLEGGMRVTVVAPSISRPMREAVETAASRAACRVERRRFVRADLEGRALVVAATDDAGVNRRIAEACRAAGVPINVADEPRLGDVIFPSLINRAPIRVAISTEGVSPLLARLLKAYLSGCIPSAYGRLAELAARYRPRVKQRFAAPRERRRFWDKVLRGRVADQIFAGRYDQAEAELETLLCAGDTAPVGEIYLVGSGPGDPDLLTVKALRLMQRADVVLYDRLVSDSILRLLRDDVEKIYAGKERARHTMPQERINELLVRFASRGKKVLRLKGGDPFVFGRGGEEIETLMERGIPFQVVPGITAALGCAAYAGIPLTHRDYAHACIFATGHRKDRDAGLDWEMLARPSQTLVFYMGFVGLEGICARLMGHGLPPRTPAALVTRGTLPDQRVLLGDLSTLPALTKTRQIAAPTLLIVGEVVRLHDKLQWYGTERNVQAQGGQPATG